MKFLSKAELRYLVKSKKYISECLKNELIDYCHKTHINLNKWSMPKEEWENYSRRIELNKTDNEFRLRKLISAKKGDIRGEFFAIILIAILLVTAIYFSIAKGIDGYEAIMALIFIPVLTLMIVELSKRNKLKKEELLEDKEMIINRKKLTFRKDGREIIQGEISSFYYYWKEGSEAGELPTVTLDIKLEDKKVIRVDEEGGYKELLILSDELAQKIDADLIFVNKNAPMGYNARL